MERVSVSSVNQFVDPMIVGWSTAIPNYNPVDIVDNLRRMMKGEEPVPMTPWYRGFKVSVFTPWISLTR